MEQRAANHKQQPLPQPLQPLPLQLFPLTKNLTFGFKKNIIEIYGEK
jgi:hypothetical protein